MALGEWWSHKRMNITNSSWHPFPFSVFASIHFKVCFPAWPLPTLSLERWLFWGPASWDIACLKSGYGSLSSGSEVKRRSKGWADFCLLQWSPGLVTILSVPKATHCQGTGIFWRRQDQGFRLRHISCLAVKFFHTLYLVSSGST